MDFRGIQRLIFDTVYNSKLLDRKNRNCRWCNMIQITTKAIARAGPTAVLQQRSNKPSAYIRAFSVHIKTMKGNSCRFGLCLFGVATICAGTTSHEVCGITYVECNHECRHRNSIENSTTRTMFRRSISPLVTYNICRNFRHRKTGSNDLSVGLARCRRWKSTAMRTKKPKMTI